MKPTILSKNAEREILGLADARTTGGQYSLIEIILQPGARVPWHNTRETRTAFYILDGIIQIQCGDTLYTAGAGGSLYRACRTPFCLEVMGNSPARLLALTLPGSESDAWPETQPDDTEVLPVAVRERITLPDSRQHGRLIEMGNHRGRCLLCSSQTGGALSLIHILADPGSGIPLHFHVEEEEGMYVLSGRLGMCVGNRERWLGPGEFGFGPHTIPHSWRVSEKDGPTEYLLFVTPGGFEHFMAEVEPLMSQPGPPNLPMLQAVCARYNIHFSH